MSARLAVAPQGPLSPVASASGRACSAIFPLPAPVARLPPIPPRGAPMIDRRRVVRLALAALPAAVLTRAVHAQQAFERFYPFLIDLPGFTGDKPDGLAMQLPGNNNMMTATRAYRHEGAKLNVQVITGPAAQGGLAMIQSGMKMETGDA